MPMRFLAAASVLLLAACAASVQGTAPAASGPEAVVRAHVDAFNRRDIEAFMATYATGAVHLRYPADTVFAGTARIRRHYAELFEDAPELRAEVVERMVSGPFVIQRERVSGLPGEGTHVGVVIYEIVDGRIRRASFLD